MKPRENPSRLLAQTRTPENVADEAVRVEPAAKISAARPDATVGANTGAVTNALIVWEAS